MYNILEALTNNTGLCHVCHIHGGRPTSHAFYECYFCRPEENMKKQKALTLEEQRILLGK